MLARGLDLAAEVRRVERLAQHGLVHLAQLGEREGLAEEGVRDPAVLELVAQPPEGVLDDAVVVEGELGQLVGGEPAHVLAVGRLLRELLAHERPVDDRDDAAGRGAVEVAEGVELLEVGGRELGGLEELARGGLGEALGLIRPSAGQRPPAVERLAGAPHERDREHHPLALGRGPQGEDHGRDREFDAHEGFDFQ